MSSSPHTPPDLPSPPNGGSFQPFVSPHEHLRELTIRGVVLGSFLGLIFAASSVYLGLKVGLTVSASIPVAVLSITVLKWLETAFGLTKGTILENNIVQTTGSAGESIAAGVAFTLPSLLLMGFDMELARILIVALLGGLIGVLMMIPLRHGLMVKEHGKLTYPEGTACAEVLVVGEKGGTSAKTVFLGFFVGFGYAFLNLICKLWADVSTFGLSFWAKLKGATLAFEVAPTMLGVGYIIGPRTSANMMAGGALAFLVLVPLIHLFGDSMLTPMYPATKLISAMTPGDIRNNFILYIGAGAVATGGFIALGRSIPSIVRAFAKGIGALRGSSGGTVLRTEQDLPMSVVVGGSIALAIAIWLAPVLEINPLSAVLIVLFGFFFVTVSSRITGEIGSSSNPISGMTVATLLATCGIFVLLGWTGVSYKALALTTAALVCVAASNGGTISQDLKTGFLVGATPRAQQLSILVGVITSAILIGFVLIFLNTSRTTFEPVHHDYRATVADKAERMKGPDGKEYSVTYLREESEENNELPPRGKYLADESGSLVFLVDPGVCGSYTWKLRAPASPARLAEVPANAPTELGLDHHAYKVVTTETQIGTVKPGSYLVNDQGDIAYEREKVDKFDAPKAQLFRLIIDGTLGGKLPWGLVLVGMFFAILMELVGVSSLPFAVGLYLPISTSGGIFAGGLVRWFVERTKKQRKESESDFSPGMLLASGLIAGGAIAGVAQSVIAVFDAQSTFEIGTLFHNETWWPMVPFVAMAVLLYLVGVGRKNALKL